MNRIDRRSGVWSSVGFSVEKDKEKRREAVVKGCCRVSPNRAAKVSERGGRQKLRIQRERDWQKEGAVEVGRCDRAHDTMEQQRRRSLVQSQDRREGRESARVPAQGGISEEKRATPSNNYYEHRK